MIYCCGGFHSPQRELRLYSNMFFSDRKVEVVTCPVCGRLIAELTQYNVKKKEVMRFRPKKKQLAEFIKAVEEKRLWNEPNAEFGTRFNAAFVYGFNVELHGKIYQYAVDFNNTKRLVRVIEKGGGEYNAEEEKATG